MAVADNMKAPVAIRFFVWDVKIGTTYRFGEVYIGLFRNRYW